MCLLSNVQAVVIHVAEVTLAAIHDLLHLATIEVVIRDLAHQVTTVAAVDHLEATRPLHLAAAVAQVEAHVVLLEAVDHLAEAAEEEDNHNTT